MPLVVTGRPRQAQIIAAREPAENSGLKTKKWKRKSSCEKADAPDVTEDVGVEEEKGGEPAPPSPPPRALQDHNDNEETKDEAKAKVKKTPAKKGYVSARVKKIEGKE